MNKSLLVKSLWFQCLWFLAVIGRDSTVLLLFICVLASIAFSYKKQHMPLSWLAMVVLVGVSLDLMHSFVGLFEFPDAGIPGWLALLWVSFVWYAYQMKSILTHFPLSLVCMVGALGAAGSYYAGMSFGAVHWPYANGLTAIILMIEWALVFALIIFSLNALQARQNGVKHHETDPT
ncbi:hypothetical protein A9264_06535 [Vibrio sp. UCD-FRSSP16_10]|nr:hypothetical protein A9264_06535 [Vibrio sp. UCD-FRSSP16_10]OBT17830.1 hypothetical protein A9260_00530 [Vibrio sp. UCD-FRSSP16_30]